MLFLFSYQESVDWFCVQTMNKNADDRIPRVVCSKHEFRLGRFFLLIAPQKWNPPIRMYAEILYIGVDLLSSLGIVIFHTLCLWLFQNFNLFTIWNTGDKMPCEALLNVHYRGKLTLCYWNNLRNLLPSHIRKISYGYICCAHFAKPYLQYHMQQAVSTEIFKLTSSIGCKRKKPLTTFVRIYPLMFYNFYWVTCIFCRIYRNATTYKWIS